MNRLRMAVAAVVVLAVVLPGVGVARSPGAACRKRCAQGAETCTRALRLGHAACPATNREARRQCRLRQRILAKAGLRSCRGYRTRCRACCRTGAPDCAVTPDTVAATVTDAGGTIAVRGFEGGTLAIDIRAGALGQPTEIRLQPLAADAGSLARFRIWPAGLTFTAAATLRYATGHTLPARSVLRWRVAGAHVPLPTTRQGDALRADTFGLGYPSDDAAAPHARATATRSAAVRPRATEGPSIEIDVAPLDCDFELAALQLQLAGAANENDLARAQAQFDRLQAVVATCALRERAELTARACSAYQAAVLTAQAVAADTFQRFRDVVTPLLLTQAGVQVTGATCETASLDALLQAKLGQLLDFIEAEYARPDFATSFDAAVRELRRLIAYNVECQRMGLFPACSRFDTDLIPTVLDRLRDAGYRECRAAGSLLLLSQMYAERIASRQIVSGEARGSSRAAASGSYLTYGRFGYEDLEADMAYCQSTAQVRVFEDAHDVPAELEDRRVDLPASTQPGSHATTADVEVPRDGSIQVSGAIRTLTCPDGSTSADEVVASVNGVRLAARPASGATFASSTSPFDLVVTDVLAQAVPHGELAPEFTVELSREGPACSGLFSERLRLYTIRVRIDDECGYPPDRSPPGSYAVTCQSCTATGTTLQCECRSIAGYFFPTEIDLARCRTDRDIANIDGVLRCSACP